MEFESGDVSRFRELSRKTIVYFWSVLVATAALSIFYAYVRPFWADELIEFYTDSKPSVAAINYGQLHAPVSLEPPAFHFVFHFFTHLFHSPELTFRLPAVLALLVTEICVFFIALRLTRKQAVAAWAIVLPLWLASFDYGHEARIYSVLIACMAVALLSWQWSTSETVKRSLAIVGIFISLAIGVLTHYFALFSTLAIWAGELVRSYQRRRLDKGVLTALVLAPALFVFNIPYERALAPVRVHYYDLGETSWRNLPITYAFLVHGMSVFALTPRKLLFLSALYFVLFLVFAVRYGKLIWSRWKTRPVWVEAAVLATALLPFLDLVVAQVTRSYVPRYALPAVVGIAILVPSVLELYRFFRRGREVLLILLFVFGCVNAFQGAHQAQRAKQQLIASLQVSPDLAHALAGQPDQTIYVQNIEESILEHFYASRELKPHIVGFYSAGCELKWLNRDVGSRYSRSLGTTTELPFVPFKNLQSGGPKLLVLFHDPVEEWIDQELQANGAQIEPLGKAFGGDLVRVTFNPGSFCDNGQQD